MHALQGLHPLNASNRLSAGAPNQQQSCATTSALLHSTPQDCPCAPIVPPRSPLRVWSQEQRNSSIGCTWGTHLPPCTCHRTPQPVCSGAERGAANPLTRKTFPQQRFSAPLQRRACGLADAHEFSCSGSTNTL